MSPPHAPQLPVAAPPPTLLQLVSPTEQKLGVFIAAETQQACPLAPQPLQEPLAQTPRLVPQLAAGATQVPSAPQQSSVSHDPLAQQGRPVPPQLVQVPFEHSCPLAQARPVATHLLFVSQQPPPPHLVAPAQQAWPGSPQSVQTRRTGSHKRPALQVDPVQQGPPLPPQATQPMVAEQP